MGCRKVRKNLDGTDVFALFSMTQMLPMCETRLLKRSGPFQKVGYAQK